MNTNQLLKHSRAFALFVVLFFASSLSAETIRVASYNLYNYLDANRWVEGHYRMAYPKPEAEKAAARKVIAAVHPDILTLQEIGGPLHLQELQTDLKKAGVDYPYAECLIGPDEDRRIAVLSKIPFEAVGHTELDFKYFDGRELIKRGLLELRFGKGDTAWTLFVVHLKSRWTTRDDDPESGKRRTGEAHAARNFIREQYPPETNPRYLVVGDFNDTKRSAPIRRFLEVGDTQLTQLLPAGDSRGEAWTFHYRAEDKYERVDFILASPALAPFVEGGETHIYDSQPETSNASDHRLIYVDLSNLPRSGG
ncbi:endonuclease/exonuclease/phosphatase family protein [Cerasicoccus maritimus]|uniref:endonuclease/exonuclease/phosphatase family protein n=1 Tax=Cerasicoccus maritimus TaxID=490089 RepID=UPI002852CE2A|nr:endonuclease/exonuclease/phosphatase family protein [Cerasicoccus maritimus]